MIAPAAALRNRAPRDPAVAARAVDGRRQRHRFRATRRRRTGAARAPVRVSARQRARASARDACPCGRSRRNDALRAVRAHRRRRRRRAGARAAGGAPQGPRLRHAGVAQGRRRRDGALHHAAPRGARPRADRDSSRSSMRSRSRHDLRAALGDARTAAMGDRQRARAGIRRALLLDHRLDQRLFRRSVSPRRSSARRRARCCIFRRRRPRPRRRCCSPIRSGRGRSRSSAARSACRRATRQIPACCWHSPSR